MIDVQLYMKMAIERSCISAPTRWNVAALIWPAMQACPSLADRGGLFFPLDELAEQMVEAIDHVVVQPVVGG